MKGFFMVVGLLFFTLTMHGGLVKATHGVSGFGTLEDQQKVIVIERKHPREENSRSKLEKEVISNHEVSNSASCSAANRLEKGFRREGYVVRTVTVSDAVSCVNLCAKAVHGCVSANYYENAGVKTCDFLGEVGTIYPDSDYSTALVNPYEESVCDPGNFILNYDRAGQDINGSPFKLTSPRGCCLYCYYRSDCVGFVYDLTNQNCWLKRGFPAFTPKQKLVYATVCKSANCS